VCIVRAVRKEGRKSRRIGEESLWKPRRNGKNVSDCEFIKLFLKFIFASHPTLTKKRDQRMMNNWNDNYKSFARKLEMNCNLNKFAALKSFLRNYFTKVPAN
jgi:hypothetical protein